MREAERISIVIPVLDEAENLPVLHDRLDAVLSTLPCTGEILFVDDGSSDGSDRVIRELSERDPRVRALFFTRNFGHERALTAGLDRATGDVVVIMDADLQDSPELIPELLEKWREGYDIVGARRSIRHGEGPVKKSAAYLFYRLMRRLAPWETPLDTGNFCLIDRQVAQAFRRCREWNRFVRVLLAWTGYRQTTVEFERSPRHAGRTKYGTRNQLGLAATSVVSYSLLPLRLIVATGLAVMAGSLAALAVMAVRALVGAPPSGLAFLGICILLMGGLQCLFLGVVGEHVGRTLMEAQRRPLYLIRDSVGFDDYGAESREEKADRGARLNP